MALRQHAWIVSAVISLLFLRASLFQLQPPEKEIDKSSLKTTCTRPKTVRNFDIYDQNRFKQPLEGECQYHDDKNGLFIPGTAHPRYIITGGAGFVGSHLVKALRNTGVPASQIKVIDNLSSGRLANFQYYNGSWAISATADFCAMDLRNEQDTIQYVRGADFIYHLADVEAGRGCIFSHQQAVSHHNLLINTHTLQASKRNGIANYIYVGSACSSLYGLQKSPEIYPLVENQTYPGDPESAYGRSKLEDEYEAEIAMEPGVFNVGLLRFHNVYGPLSDYGMVSGQTISSLLHKALAYPYEEFVVKGSGSQYHNFVHVDDIVEALLLVRDKGMNKGVIELGSKHATTILNLATEIAEIVGKRTGHTIPVKFDNCQPENYHGHIATGDQAEKFLGWEPIVPLRHGLESTVDWMEQQSNRTSVLVILIGEARGGRLAWKSALEHLVKPYGAHLATFFTDSSPQTILQQTAQYNWIIPEVDDWGVYFEQASHLCGHLGSTQEWRSLCQIKNQWLGGVKGCDHSGSAGILLAFRWLVSQKLLSLNLSRQYDYFVLTRADFLYLCDHTALVNLDKHSGYVPYGEEYGGYTDRHLVGSKEVFSKMINITQQLVCNVDHFKEVLNRSHPYVNLEKTQRLIWEDLQIPITQFNTSFFSVKLPEDPTRWSRGTENEILSAFDGLLVKYKNELTKSLQTCNVDLRSKLEFLNGTYRSNQNSLAS